MPLIEMDPEGVWERSPRWGKWALFLSALFFILVLALLFVS